MKRLAVKCARYALGLVIGAGSALIELVCALLTGVVLLPVLVWPRGRRAVLRRVTAVGRWLVRFEAGRLEHFHDVRLPSGYQDIHEDTDAQSIRYLALRWPLGLLGMTVLFVGMYGVGLTVFALVGWMVTDIEHPWLVMLSGFGGLFLLFLGLQGIFGVATLEEHLAVRFVGDQQDELERRIEQLATSRSDVVDAIHDERRRIERDLHDGVQQRLVALGMLLGRARRSREPQRAAELLLQAHEESRRALAELREVAWRVHPAVLDEAGLKAALESVAERSPLPVRLTYEVGRPLHKQVETVAYFIVSECVTNVVKHAGATRIDVRITEDERGDLIVRVRDDGGGGADPFGGGLTGLASRVAALDGVFAVDSPAGGPTVVRAGLPCA
ncbi:MULTISPECIES: sensor histidine kinase [Streptomyces]|uniref:histidine kinase n=1 Tax=Streptomyces solicathayae TaxID=3081768 RepID=A0ABZ0LYZ1_9ACTN|nr:histidine kinase [Streptomyces sp. HUAS YS2]WOX24585.1 histidine kinase [Streptomyces sp. HUAS YS2]